MSLESTHRGRIGVSRRDWLCAATASALVGGSPWFRSLAAQAAESPAKGMSCILLWMGGGPSQLETLDPKPGHGNGGPTKDIATAVPGIRISEHLPKVAARMKDLALIRSMSTKEGDHQRASFVAHTGRVPQGPIAYPTLGSFACKELGGPEDLPQFVSINSQQFFGDALGSGFLGPSYSPLQVGGNGYGVAASPDQGSQALAVANLTSGLDQAHQDRRWKLLQSQQAGFTADHPDVSVRSQLSALDRAKVMMEGRAKAVFSLDDEPQPVRDKYGDGAFGRGCLLARRMVEVGVPFVEVALNGWDTHTNNFEQSKQLCGQLDSGWAALLEDLGQRGLLDSTLVVWMGEFGRTPGINPSNGRDHYPQAWSAALAGAGLAGGQVVGSTSKNGTSVEDRPVNAPQMLATICTRLGLDVSKQNMSNIGRPIRLIDPGVEPVKELL